MWAKFNNRQNAYNTWIIADGPVDAIWIEDLNTVLDDNKILTLANGDRMPMTDNVKAMFEVCTAREMPHNLHMAHPSFTALLPCALRSASPVTDCRCVGHCCSHQITFFVLFVPQVETLVNASPATVSRAGIIFVSDTDLDWSPVVEGWILKRPAAEQPVFKELFSRFASLRLKCSSLSSCPLKIKSGSNLAVSALSTGCSPRYQNISVALVLYFVRSRGIVFRSL